MAPRQARVIPAIGSGLTSKHPLACWIFVLLSAGINAFAQHQFETFTTENRLSRNSIHALEQARDGHLWLTSAEAMQHVDPAETRDFHQSKTPGVNVNGFSSHAFPENGKGARWAGIFDRGIVRHHAGISAAYTMKQGLPSNTDYRLDKYRQGRIWIFTSGGLAPWSGSRLPPSRKFKMMARNADRVWNRSGTDLAVFVLPPFYRSWWFLTLALLCGAGLLSSRWQRRMSNLARDNLAQRAFTLQLISSQEAERKRIAAELHDSLGQHLLVIKNWAVLGLRAQRNPRLGVTEPLNEISATASRAIDEVRRIAYNLRPYQLEKLGLTTAIQDLVYQVGASTTIRFTAEIDSLDDTFSKDVEISIYRIIQESLNNIVRHAEATQARVLVARRGELVELTIQDNGRGLVAIDEQAPERERKGFGLLGISERVRMLGGQVEIHSTPGAGSSIRICLKTKRAA